MARPPFALAALLTMSCSLTSLAERESPIAVNHCDKDVPCPSGSSCREARCIADSGSLSTFVFAVSTPAGKLAGQQLFRTASVPLNARQFSLGLAGIAKVSGAVQAVLPAGCEMTATFEGPTGITLRRALDNSIPVRLSFYPSERTLDLPASPATALVELDESGVVPPSYPFGAQLPAGKYDVYIQPFDVTVSSPERPLEGCSIPPELIRGAAFDGSVQFMHQLPVPAHLDLKVNWSDRTNMLDGWVVDMLEPVTGRLISTRAKLSLPTNTDGLLVYSVGIDYLPVLENDQQITGNEIVRLSPPESVVAPTILFQRSALELFTKGKGVIDQLTAIPKTISFQGQVIDAEYGDPQFASVTLTATEIAGLPAGTLASFTRSVQTREDGTFSLELLPGTYRVLASPVAGPNSATAPFAATAVTWKITDSPAKQAGRAVALLPARAVSGRVTTPWGDPARGAAVSGEPSPGTLPTDVFAQSLGSLPLVPRATSAVVDDSSGAFTLFADPGDAGKPNLFDFSVRPPAGSNFAWLLVPRVGLESDGPDPVELGELRLPAPAQLDLTVELSGNPLSQSLLVGANVRVYALLDEAGMPTNDPALAKSAVAIAESSLDAMAHATVLLPPSLGQPPQ